MNFIDRKVEKEREREREMEKDDTVYERYRGHSFTVDSTLEHHYRINSIIIITVIFCDINSFSSRKPHTYKMQSPNYHGKI